jgi:hypothetical protein
MPYKVVKADSKGYFVEDTKTKKKFSKKPLTKPVARKQQVAIALSEAESTGKPAGMFFE